MPFTVGQLIARGIVKKAPKSASGQARYFVKGSDKAVAVNTAHRQGNALAEAGAATGTVAKEAAKKANPYMGRKSFRGADEAAQRNKVLADARAATNNASSATRTTPAAAPKKASKAGKVDDIRTTTDNPSGEYFGYRGTLTRNGKKYTFRTNPNSGSPTLMMSGDMGGARKVSFKDQKAIDDLIREEARRQGLPGASRGAPASKPAGQMPTQRLSGNRAPSKPVEAATPTKPPTFDGSDPRKVGYNFDYKISAADIDVFRRAYGNGGVANISWAGRGKKRVEQAVNKMEKEGWATVTNRTATSADIRLTGRAYRPFDHKPLTGTAPSPALTQARGAADDTGARFAKSTDAKLGKPQTEASVANKMDLRGTKSQTDRTIKVSGDGKAGSGQLMNDLKKELKDIEERQYNENVARWAKKMVADGPTNGRVYNNAFKNRSPMMTALNWRNTGNRVKVTYYDAKLGKMRTETRDEYLVTFNEAGMKKAAKEYAEAVSNEAMNKINAKLPGLVAQKAKIHFPSYTVTGKIGDDVVEITQQSIINRSGLGKLFNQYPARVKLNGRGSSEDAIKGHLKAKGLSTGPNKIKGKLLNEKNPDGPRFTQSSNRRMGGTESVIVYDNKGEVVERIYTSGRFDKQYIIEEIGKAARPGVKVEDAVRIGKKAGLDRAALRDAQGTLNNLARQGIMPKPLGGGYKYQTVKFRDGRKQVIEIKPDGSPGSVRSYSTPDERASIIAELQTKHGGTQSAASAIKPGTA